MNYQEMKFSLGYFMKSKRHFILKIASFYLTPLTLKRISA